MTAILAETRQKQRAWWRGRIRSTAHTRILAVGTFSHIGAFTCCWSLATPVCLAIKRKVRMMRSSIIAIGTSAGGVEALRFLVSALPERISASILIVLHIGSRRSELPALLSQAGPNPAIHANDGELLHPGRIYVAPPDRHMMVANGRFHLSRGPKENWARPAIDPLFRSVAKAYGESAVGVILTGRLNDGTLGLMEIKRHGGIAVAQDPDEAAYSDMPRSAAERVSLDFCVPLAAIPSLLIDLVKGRNRKEVAMPIKAQPNAARRPEMSNDKDFDRPVTITCPDCGGALRKSEIGSLIKFGCHIGHTYTAEIMAEAQFDATEKLMRAAVRSLNERAEFCRLMADHTELTPDGFNDWRDAAKQAIERAYKMRDIVEQDWIIPSAAGRVTT